MYSCFDRVPCSFLHADIFAAAIPLDLSPLTLLRGPIRLVSVILGVIIAHHSPLGPVGVHRLLVSDIADALDIILFYAF